MTSEDLRAWQAYMNLTYEKAADELGMSRSGYAKLLARAEGELDKRTALACGALAAGTPPWPMRPQKETP